MSLESYERMLSEGHGHRMAVQFSRRRWDKWNFVVGRVAWVCPWCGAMVPGPGSQYKLRHLLWHADMDMLVRWATRLSEEMGEADSYAEEDGGQGESVPGWEALERPDGPEGSRASGRGRGIAFRPRSGARR